MPKHHKKTKHHKKKPANLDGAKYSSRIMKAPSTGLPTQFRDKMTYGLSYGAFPGGFGVETRVFRSNNCFDPEAATGGSSVYGYNLVSSMYKSYTIMGSRIKCKFACLADNNSASILAVTLNHLPTYGGTTTLLSNTIATMPNTRYKLVQNARGGNPPSHLSLGYNAKTYNGEKYPADASALTCSSLNAADPQNPSYFLVSVINQGSSTASWQVYITIEYDVLWRNLKEQSGVDFHDPATTIGDTGDYGPTGPSPFQSYGTGYDNQV